MEKKFNCLTFFNVVQSEESQYWCVGRYDNALFKVDFDSMIAERVVTLPRAGRYTEFLYTYVVSSNNVIVALPQNGFNIAVYNRNTGKVTSCCVVSEKKYGGYNAVGGLTIGGKIFLFSCYKDVPALSYDLDKNTVHEVYNWHALKERYGLNSRDYMIENVSEFKSGAIFAISGTGIIIYYDLLNDKFTEVANIKNESFSKSYLFDNKLYTMSKDCVSVIDIFEGEIVENYNYSTVIKNREIINLLVSDKVIVAIPRYGSKVYLIERKDGKIIEIETDYGELTNLKAWTNRFFLNGKIGDEYIILYPYNCNKIVRIDINSYKVEVMPMRFFYDDNDISKYVDLIYQGFVHEEVLQEGNIAIQDYLDLVTMKN